jgi:putative salt-induced outer membrane protein YdiY
LILGGSVALADVVTLSDGSRIVGTVGRTENAKLKVETQFAGTLEIDATKIVSVQTDKPVNVGLKSGKNVLGKIEWDPTAKQGVVRTEQGDVSIAMDTVAAIWPEGDKSPAVLAKEAEIEKKRPKWSATLEAGILAKEGNNDILEVRGRGEVRRKSEKDLWRFYIGAQYGEQNDVRSVNEIIGGAYFEHLFTEKLFGYLGQEFEYDEFEQLDLRSTTTAGAGYYWIKEEHHELKNRVGLGYRHQKWEDGETTEDVIVDLGLDYRLDITPWLQFTSANTYQPSIEELRIYRLVSDNAFLIPIADSDIWKIKLGALYEYYSVPPPDTERLDQTYYANIVLDIK